MSEPPGCLRRARWSTSLISETMLALSHSCALIFVGQTKRPHLGPVRERAHSCGCVLQCFQVGVSRPRPPWFSTVFFPCPSLSGSFSWTTQVSLLHSSIAPSIPRQTSSDKPSWGNFAWISCVVSSPGVACLLPSMICFASLRQRLFALKMALFILLR